MGDNSRYTGEMSLNHRQKTLIGLLQSFGGHVSSRDFQKYLFLYTQECQVEPAFDFVPYKFGSFSFQSYADKRKLIELDILKDVEGWKINDAFSFESAVIRDKKFQEFYDKYSRLRGNKLVQTVYRQYPYYATRSEIAHQLMDDNELLAIDAEKPRQVKPCFFTIGYEGSSFDGYLNRLLKNNIKALVDVRRNPLSRKYGFSKKTLSSTLEKLDIAYIHIPELGIASDKRESLITQKDYDKLFSEYEKCDLKKNVAALEELYRLFLDHKRLAITCFEADVCMCHRGRIAKAISQLPKWKYEIKHL